MIEMIERNEVKQSQLIKRIATIQHTRQRAALLLAETLKNTAHGESEHAICERWTGAIASVGSLCSEGWYQPPPKGASILIGDQSNNFARMKYDSLRNPTAWPRTDIKLTTESLIYAYASPIDRTSGLVGDIGLTLYRGSNQSILDHLTRCLELTKRIASFPEVGMELREVFSFAQSIMAEHALSNQASSFGSKIPNIGHTIPWSYADYTPEARKSIELGDLQHIRDQITKSRVFINDTATLRIQPSMAFTIEPQIGSSTIPICSYHVIVAFMGGKRTILSIFKPIIEVFAKGTRLDKAITQLFEA